MMTEAVVTIGEEETVATAIATMKERETRCLVVQATSEHDPYGIVTQRDICYKVIAKDLDPDEVQVRDIMSQPLVLVSPNFRVNHVAKMMANTGLSRLPVIFGGELQGIVTVTDVINAV